VKLRRVDPRKIHVPEVRVTARMDEEINAEFRHSVETIGIDEPIKCYLVGEELWLSDGLHRLNEAMRLNVPLVDVNVREGTMVDVIANNLMSGHLRGKHPPSEMVRSIELLWKTHGLDSEQIAAKTGLTRERVEDLQLISELTPMCRAALDEGKIKLGHAKVLTLVKDPVQQETLLGQLLLAGFSVKDFEDVVRQSLAIKEGQVLPSVPVEPVGRVPIACFYCSREYDPSVMRNPNTCNECAGILLRLAAEARYAPASGEGSKAE